MNEETKPCQQCGEKPPARPIYRKLALGLAVISLLLAIVAATGLMGDGMDIYGMGLFLFLGYMFWIIARTGYWPPRHPPADNPQAAAAARTYGWTAVFCLVICLMGVQGLVHPGKVNGFVERMLNWAMLVTGGIGTVANLWAFLRQRKK